MNRRLVHEMARVDADWEVTAVAPTYFRATNDLRPVTLETKSDEPCQVVPVSAYATGRSHLFLYGLQLRSLMAEQWDMIHCWEEPYILVGGQMALWTPQRTPLVFCSCQSIDKRYPIPFNWIERYAMQRASGWVCIGETVSQVLSARPGYGQIPHEYIPLGVDLTAFHPDITRRESTLRKLGWDANGPPIVGYLGRFAPEKGLEVMQRALDDVRTPWRALFVGAGPALAGLRAWAERYGDRVRICTDVTHDYVPGYLNAMDLMCAPSQTMPNWREQFGRMTVEAFASGVAFIGSDSGEIPFVVRDSGVIVGEKDVPGWTRAIGALIEDGTHRGELASRGLARAREEFAWPVVGRRYLDFFERVLATQGAN
jgi:phosphatidyl-myo-inositol dimannoside synthase